MNVTVESPKWEFSWNWLVELIERILKDVFGFIEETEWADKEEAAK